MRDPNRIPKFCNKLAEIWSKYPDFRFGQFIMNAFDNVDIWYAEDDKIIQHLENWMNSILPKEDK